MRSLLIWLAVWLLVGALVIELIDNDPGYVLISIWQTRIELSFWLALGIVIGLSVSISFIRRFLRGSLQSSQSFLGKMFGGSARRASRKTQQGLVDFLEGNWRQSRKQLLAAAKKSEMPLVNYLAAARSAHELGDREEALELLHKAEKLSPDSEFAIALAQARMELADNKFEQCIGTLMRAKRLQPTHPAVLDLLRQSYQAIEDWKSMLDLLPALKRAKIIAPEAFQTLERNTQKASLENASDLESMNTQWKALASPLKKDSVLIGTYVARLQSLGDAAQGEALLRNTLVKHWDEDLLHLYGLIEGKDIARQLKTAEGWLKERPANAQLLLTLGRLSMRNELWGRAREYFQTSLSLQKDPNAFAELARLLAHLGEHEESTHYYQEGLLMTAEDLPTLPLPNQ